MPKGDHPLLPAGGLLRKPRNSGPTPPPYTNGHVERILLIKELRDGFTLPSRNQRNPQTSRRQSTLRPGGLRFPQQVLPAALDRLLATEILSRDARRRPPAWAANGWRSWRVGRHHRPPGRAARRPRRSHPSAAHGGHGRAASGPKKTGMIRRGVRNASRISPPLRAQRPPQILPATCALLGRDRRQKGSRFAEIMSLFFTTSTTKLGGYHRLRSAAGGESRRR